MCHRCRAPSTRLWKPLQGAGRGLRPRPRAETLAGGVLRPGAVRTPRASFSAGGSGPEQGRRRCAGYDDASADVLRPIESARSVAAGGGEGPARLRARREGGGSRRAQADRPLSSAAASDRGPAMSMPSQARLRRQRYGRHLICATDGPRACGDDALSEALRAPAAKRAREPPPKRGLETASRVAPSPGARARPGHGGSSRGPGGALALQDGVRGLGDELGAELLLQHRVGALALEGALLPSLE